MLLRGLFTPRREILGPGAQCFLGSKWSPDVRFQFLFRRKIDLRVNSCATPTGLNDSECYDCPRTECLGSLHGDDHTCRVIFSRIESRSDPGSKHKTHQSQLQSFHFGQIEFQTEKEKTEKKPILSFGHTSFISGIFHKIPPKQN